VAETLVRYMYGYNGRQLDVFQGGSYEVRAHACTPRTLPPWVRGGDARGRLSLR
jgi:hypothetical protein